MPDIRPTRTDLITLVRAHYPEEAVTRIAQAYDFAADAHRGYKRYSGDDYIVHPTATAMLLARIELPVEVVIAGLLHDVLEDSPTSQADLEKAFGADITGIVVGVTKLGTLKYRGVERYVENLRNMFVAMAADVRVIFVKFADRIHNLATLDAAPESKRRRIALESLELYAPIANRLGMGEIRGAIEDFSFAYVSPKEYQWVTDLARTTRSEKAKFLEQITRIVEKDLTQANIPVLNISGREKHLYSLYKKLLNHDRDISKIYDLVALRIQVPTVGDCYATLGTIHSRWKPLKGRIKDYIAQPKPNGYQSLHTTVFAEDGEIIEIQIRTPEMHDAAEYGIAAHWHYTEEGKKSRAAPADQVAWFSELARLQKDVVDHEEFLQRLEVMKVDFFHNRIFVFTPTGDVIDLPEDATPVDFAYAIHTEIGNHCTGARVNDDIVPLARPLKSGDVVEILTDKKRKKPSADWLKFVKTHNARNKIKAETKSQIGDWIKSIITPRKDGSP